jgi:DNA repair protein RadC
METAVQLTFVSEQLAAVRKREKRAEQVRSKLLRIHEELNALYGSQPDERPGIHSPRDTAALVTPFLTHLGHEEMWLVLLDTRNRVIKLVQLYQGTLNTSNVRIAEVFRPAILENAAAMILVHNHPSGDPAPSPEDVALTQAAAHVGKMLDIAVLDHLVIGQEDFVSLKERGIAF